MRPIWHILSSFILGVALFIFTRSIMAGLIALFVGVFIDLDHLIDFWMYEPENKFSVKRFYHMDRHLKSKWDRSIFIFLHSWELIIVLSLLTLVFSNIYFISLVLTILLHFMLDHFNLEKKDAFLFYSLVFRASKKFQLNDKL